MNKIVIAGAILVALFAGACSAPPPAPTSFPTLPPVPLTLAAAAPTTKPTSTAEPTSTATLTSTANPQLTPTPSRAASSQSPSSQTALPQTPTLAASPSSVPTSPAAGFPPGVYVTDLRTDPSPPNRTAELRFFATFANSTGSPQGYRWIVYIFRFDAPSRSTGETTQTQVNLPVGSSEQKSDGFWRLGPGNQCENFFARVAWLDQDKRSFAFTRPDGKVFEKSLTLCP